MVADGFDEAFIALIERSGLGPIALYDTEKCLRILVRDGMNEFDAVEYFDFNVLGAYVGERTPMFTSWRP